MLKKVYNYMLFSVPFNFYRYEFEYYPELVSGFAPIKGGQNEYKTNKNKKNTGISCQIDLKKKYLQILRDARSVHQDAYNLAGSDRYYGAL